MNIAARINGLRMEFRGEISLAEAQRIAYATDASIYRELPLGVCWPRDTDDLQVLVRFAALHGISLTPRAAGTSLAGQAIGSGLVVDLSKYFTEILDFDAANRCVWVQPGVVRDALNLFLKQHGLFFGPETSTSNRCNIGGMLGNNACGAQSVVYGSTRDKTLAVEAVLADGSLVVFENLDAAQFEAKLQLDSLEGRIYKDMSVLLRDEVVRSEILAQFPKSDIRRRNTGYAVDILAESAAMGGTLAGFNMAHILAGSEGTLAFSTRIKLELSPLPPPTEGVLAVHCASVDEALRANLCVLDYKPHAVELMDDVILECTLAHPVYRENAFFVEGKPKAILLVQFFADTEQDIRAKVRSLLTVLKIKELGYAYPLILGNDTQQVWNLRKAGLGLLANVKGPKRSTTVIEDTAVSVADLPAYIADFEAILLSHGLSCVFYGHVATGELHLRPLLDLRDASDLKTFREIGSEVALLVKKYRGSLSGEHGDGRLRAEFMPLVLGEKNMDVLRKVKQIWDAKHILNPGKIVDAPPMDSGLRLDRLLAVPTLDTVFDFGEDGGIVQAAERCNGSGDCRKLSAMGGTMCPSFRATRNEIDSTRARANLLRDVLTRSSARNRFDSKELKEAFDLCLLCKACKSECPSGVDVAKLKMEFLQQYRASHGGDLRSFLVAYLPVLNRWVVHIPKVYNYLIHNILVKNWVLSPLGFSAQRSLPKLVQSELPKAMKARRNTASATVCLFVDEFAEYHDPDIALSAIAVLEAVGFRVVLPKHVASGRTYLSKGYLLKAKELAVKNVTLLSAVVRADLPLVGIEPSAILAFRDEYPDLLRSVSPDLYAKAQFLAQHSFTFEEFLLAKASDLVLAAPSAARIQVLYHGHCQQKALVKKNTTVQMLHLFDEIEVREIASGCCGMAGSFGFEKEHYEVSMKIGEETLFPEVRNAAPEVVIAASGTSCRHQIADGTGRIAIHPIQLVHRILIARRMVQFKA